MADKAWKRWERKVAALFGTKRIPVDGRTTSSLDISTDRHAVQCKYWAKLPYRVEQALIQAEHGGGEGQMPLAIIGAHNRPWHQALVVMRLSEYVSWYDPAQHGE